MYAHIGRLAILQSLRYVCLYTERRRRMLLFAESGPKKKLSGNGLTKDRDPTATLNRS